MDIISNITILYHVELCMLQESTTEQYIELV